MRRLLQRSTGTAIATVAMTVVALLTVSAQPAAADGAASKYVAVGPVRLADTRSNTGFTRLNASTIRVAVAGRGGVPADATAAVLTVTVAGTSSAGYATVYPAGTNRPATSTLNVNGPGATVANSTIIPLAAGGVDILASTGMQLIVDVTGAFVPTGSSATAGRLTVITNGAIRAIDTRSGPRLTAATTTRVARPSSIPADAAALVANVTVTDTAGAGFWTAYPAGRNRPDASIVNSDAPGQTRAALTIIAMTPNGIDVYGSVGAHLIVDITGYFTGAGASGSGDGLFVPLDPTRVLDTRRANPVAAESTVEFASSRPGMAQVFNLTTTQARRTGYVTAFPAGHPRPATSNVNAPAPGMDVANLSITGTSDRGVGLYSATGEHLIVDVTGYFTGSPLSAPNPPASDPPVPPPGPPTTTPPPTVPPTVPPTTSTPPPPSGASTSGASLPAGCTEISLDRTNQVRSGVGAGTVVPEPALARRACEWSKYMSDIDTLVHGDVSTVALPFSACSVGENIAVSSRPNDTSLFDLWMGSPGHYRNIIGASFTHVAIVYYTGPNGGTWGTMEFAGTCK